MDNVIESLFYIHAEDSAELGCAWDFKHVFLNAERYVFGADMFSEPNQGMGEGVSGV